MKVIELLESAEAIAILANAETSVAFGMSIASLVKQVNEQLADYNKFKQDLKERYGLKEGEVLRGKALEEYNDLLQVEVTINCGKLPMSVVEKEKIHLSAVDVETLSWLLKNDVQSVFVEE